MHIRQINIDDAPQFLTLNKKLDCETQFLLKEPDERQTTLQQQRAIINDFKNNGIIVFVIKHKNTLIGFIGGHQGKARRTKHCLHIAVGILQEFINLGLGKRLFSELEAWSKNNNIHRHELTVNVHNHIAISMYKKIGFKVEGVKKHALKINDKFVNEYYMYKIIR